MEKPKQVMHASRRVRPEQEVEKVKIKRVPLGLSQQLFNFVEPLALQILKIRRRTAKLRAEVGKLQERLRKGNQKRWRRWHRKQERRGLAIVRYPMPGQLCPFRCGPKRWAKKKHTERFRRVRHYRIAVVPQFPTCEACGRSFADGGLEGEESWSEDSEVQRMEEALERRALKKLERKALLDENHVDPFLELEA